jgi:Reverse transcriptase (RNA-dependent DNA polymerase)
MLKLLDDWTEMLEHGGQIDVIYTDFEKTFNPVPHNRLISKLYRYNINEDIIKWIKAYLENRVFKKNALKMSSHISCTVI